MSYQEEWNSHTLNEASFLAWANKYFKHKTKSGAPYSVFSSLWTHERETIDWIFKYGKDLKLLTATYTEFKSFLRGYSQYMGPYTFRKPRFRRDWFWDRHGVEFRERMAYRRKKGHKKKLKAENQHHKDSWRKAKGFNKDQSKNGWRWGRGCFDNKQHNQYVRRTNRRLCQKSLSDESYWDKFPNKTKGYWRTYWD